MSVITENGTTLADEASALIGTGHDTLDDAVISLKTLLDKFTIAPDSNSTEQALQLLGTAVGRQSQYT